MWIKYSVVNILMLCSTVHHMECLEGNKLVYALHLIQHPATDKGNIPMKKALQEDIQKEY